MAEPTHTPEIRISEMGVLMTRTFANGRRLGDVSRCIFSGIADVGAELVGQTLRDGERAAHAAGDVLILAQAIIRWDLCAFPPRWLLFERVSDRHQQPYSLTLPKHIDAVRPRSPGSGAFLRVLHRLVDLRPRCRPPSSAARPPWWRPHRGCALAEHLHGILGLDPLAFSSSLAR